MRRLGATTALIVVTGCLTGCSHSGQAASVDAGGGSGGTATGGTGTGDGGPVDKAAGSGGAVSSGGSVGSGGSPGSGGSNGSGGVVGSGGSGGGSGGAVASGGSVGAGGPTGTGGSVGAGGAAATGGSGNSTRATPNCGSGTNGVTNCKPGASGAAESCCTSLDVTAGTFSRTYTYGKTTSYADSATVTAFRLDKYLVTVGRFRQFVSAWNGGYRPSAGSGKHSHVNGGQGLKDSGSTGGFEAGWDAAAWNDTANINPTCGSPADTWTVSEGAQESLPINCVNWWEAAAFCIWDGGFLPSEAEWEYAAAGGDQQRQYPWGSTSPGMGNQYAIYGDGESACYYPSGTAATCTGVANIAPVGFASQGAGRWGQLDLVGEVFEWNLDWYAKYAACTDCASLTSTGNRVMRGDLLNNATQLIPPTRFDVDPAFRAVNLGFRCARSPAGTPTPPATSGTPTVTMTGTTAGKVVPGMTVPVTTPAGCTIPSPVSFQKDVQPFLNASCGRTGAANASSGGCHVLDGDSTILEGGMNHAFDWITGTAHDTSCPEQPTPLRFEVVMAVMQQANPPTCSKSEKMPSATTPPRSPLTPCQTAILQTWMNQPYVEEFHRYDGISPTTPYAMPPSN